MKALVVVDYQNDFVDGAFGFEGAEEIEPIIADKVIDAKIQGIDIYFTRDCHGKDYLATHEGKRLPVEHCITEQGRELYGSLKGLSEGCTVIDKPTFGSQELMERMVSKGYDEVEVCGLISNICVLSNVVLVRTVLPEARITVDARAVRSNDSRLNEEALDVMESIHVDITNRG